MGNDDTITESADTLDVSKSAVHDHLSTLRALGHAKNTDGTYELTHQPLRIGFGTRERTPVYQAARTEIRTLARNTNAVATLVVPAAADAVSLRRIGARDHPVPVGGGVRLHAAAAGKAILAFRSADEMQGKRLEEDTAGLVSGAAKTVEPELL